jgi:hypothetical protein
MAGITPAAVHRFFTTIYINIRINAADDARGLCEQILERDWQNLFYFIFSFYTPSKRVHVLLCARARVCVCV